MKSAVAPVSLASHVLAKISLGQRSVPPVPRRAGSVQPIERGLQVDGADVFSRLRLLRWRAQASKCQWYNARAYSITERRHVRLFRNGRNQAVRIPVEFELPGDEAIMHRDGDRLLIEPVRRRGLIALLKTMHPLDEGFPEIDDPAPAPERVL
jgi:antitoxin VapB